ncbi:MAG: SH3 domain-containing protein [Candidatus Coatesbacteria bacterium]|nr:SH3 domain-containing protein [Candidatus Coatesbacteria bacterium]
MRTMTITLSLLTLLGGILAAYAEELPRHYIAREGVIDVYADKTLTGLEHQVSSETPLVVDSTVELHDRHEIAVRIVEPAGMAGWVKREDLLEVMTVWSDTLNLRAGPSLDDRIITTLERGDEVVYLEPTLSTPLLESNIFWRHCRVDGREGWLAEEYLIERGCLDVLQPALGFNDAGRTDELRGYLADLDLRYSDVVVELAPDGRTAAVAFANLHWTGSLLVERLFLLGRYELAVYSDMIHDHCFSDGGTHTFVCSSSMSYGRGYSPEDPYFILDNTTGEIVRRGYVHPYAFLDSEELTGRGRCGAFVGDDHLLIIEHRRPDDLPVAYHSIEDDFALPLLSLLEVSSGESRILLEPDPEWLTEHGVDDGAIRLQRSAACEESTPLIERAVETELFRRCEEQALAGIFSEA